MQSSHIAIATALALFDPAADRDAHGDEPERDRTAMLGQENWHGDDSRHLVYGEAGHAVNIGTWLSGLSRR